MKDHSKTMTVPEFVCLLIRKIIIALIWCRTFVYRVLPGYSREASIRTLTIMMVFSLFFVLMISDDERNSLNANRIIVLALGFYTIRSYSVSFKLLIRTLMSIAIFLSFCYSVLVFKQKINCKNTRRRAVIIIIVKRIRKCLYASSLIMEISMLLLIFSIGLKSYLGTGVITASSPSAVQGTNDVEETFDENKDVIMKLFPFYWERLTTQERVDVMQSICDIETNFLGIKEGITVQSDPLSPSTLGSYSDSQKRIKINLNHIETDPPKEILSILLHEVFHSCENNLAELYNSVPLEFRNLYLLRDASYYAQETVSYISFEEDPEGYKNQRLELDANQYAEVEVQKYFDYIEVLLEKEGIEVEN